jgi:hypothetical protein
MSMNPAPSLHSTILLVISKKGRGKRYDGQIRTLE